MKLFYSDTFELPLPEGHKFPMSKYRLLRERIANSRLMESCQLVVPAAASDEQLCRAHTAEYVERVSRGRLSGLEQRRIGFPWSPQMVTRARHSVGGSIAAATVALADGCAVNLAGGTHHAFADSGQGYCVFNDVCVAARCLQQQRPAWQALVIDLDVHQGNGTAAIAGDDPSIFTVSIHCADNYPYRKSAGDIDIALPTGAGDDEYLAILDKTLQTAFAKCDPDIVFYVSGADAYFDDRFGKLRLTKRGLAERDQRVFSVCRRHGVPVAVSMAGGYAHEVNDIVDIHFQTVAAATEHVTSIEIEGGLTTNSL